MTYYVGAHWNCPIEQFQCVPTTHVTEIKETYFERYTKQVSCPLALHLLDFSNCHLVLKYPSLYIKYILHDSYITTFDFMNCAFAKLVVAWLYLKKESTFYLRGVRVSMHLSEIYIDHFRIFGKSYISKWYSSSYVLHFYPF